MEVIPRAIGAHGLPGTPIFLRNQTDCRVKPGNDNPRRGMPLFWERLEERDGRGTMPKTAIGELDEDR
jgi:hypothetical protein